MPLPEGAWRPSPEERWAIQYSGELQIPAGVQVVDLDMEDTSAAQISSLHDRGLHVVCYISAGSWEPYRSDAEAYPEEILGAAYDGFPDERWVDVRSPALRPLLTRRIERAAEKGCDGVDPDNVEGFENDTGFPLTRDDQLVFDRWLFDEVHRLGMAVTLKNGSALVGELVDRVEAQVNEECIEQGACDALAPFVEAGKPVWSIEYAGAPEAVCAEATRRGFATWIKDLDLGPGGTECPLP